MAGRVVTHQHRGQAHLRRTRRLDDTPQLGDDLVAKPIAIHQHRATRGPLRICHEDEY